MAQSAEMLTKFMKRSQVRRSTTPPVRKRRKPGTVNVPFADDPSATYKVGTDPLYTKPGEAKRYVRPPSTLGAQKLPSSSFKPRKGRSANTSLKRSVAGEPPSGTMSGTYRSRRRVERARRAEDQYNAGYDRTTNRLKQPSYGSRPMGPYTGPPSEAARRALRKRRTTPPPGSAYRNKRQTN